MTLSIGVGRLAATLREGEAMAVQALDMALGRGGDQAAVKVPRALSSTAVCPGVESTAR
ncbi:MAG: hypothetical protein ACLSWY_10345 [Ruthenibacterium lactatiformans]